MGCWSSRLQAWHPTHSGLHGLLYNYECSSRPNARICQTNIKVLYSVIHLKVQRIKAELEKLLKLTIVFSSLWLLGWLLLHHLLGLAPEDDGGVGLLPAHLPLEDLVSLPTFLVSWPTPVKGRGLLEGWLGTWSSEVGESLGGSSSQLASWHKDQKVFLWMQLFTALAQVLEQVLLRHS